jgi:hypothetical protein
MVSLTRQNPPLRLGTDSEIPTLLAEKSRRLEAGNPCKPKSRVYLLNGHGAGRCCDVWHTRPSADVVALILAQLGSRRRGEGEGA